MNNNIKEVKLMNFKENYIIEYDIYNTYYSDNSRCLEHEVLSYTKEEKTKFIKKYLDLKQSKSVINIKLYFVKSKELNEKDIIHVELKGGQ